MLLSAEPTSTSTSSPNGASHGVSADMDITTRSSTGGKSGRVINKLMADNDKLNRELKVASANLEEAQRRLESARSNAETLRTQNDNLECICDANAQAMARKDRKLEELRTQLETERRRREQAEEATRVVQLERNETVARLRKEVSDQKRAADDTLLEMRRERERAEEVAGQKSNELNVLQRSFSRIDSGYQGQVNEVQRKLIKFLGVQAEESAQLHSLDERTAKTASKLSDINEMSRRMQNTFKAYRTQQETSLQGIKNMAAVTEVESERLLTELRETLSKLKWAINIKGNVKDAR